MRDTLDKLANAAVLGFGFTFGAWLMLIILSALGTGLPL